MVANTPKTEANVRSNQTVLIWTAKMRYIRRTSPHVANMQISFSCFSKGVLMRIQFIRIRLGQVAFGFVLLLLSLSVAAQAQDPVGVWSMQADAQGQVTPFTLTITREGNVLKGKISSVQYGDQDLSDLKFDSGVLTYTRKLDVAGQAVDMPFKGKIEGDKLTGSYSIQGLDLPVTGTRKTANTPAR